MLTVDVKCSFCVAVESKKKYVVSWVDSATSVFYSYLVGSSREDGMLQSVPLSICGFFTDDPLPVKNCAVLRLNTYHDFSDVS